MKERVNLYIDESGIGNISNLTYRFFMMSAVIMSESEKEKAASFFSCWKEKYTIDPELSFHSTDFFEDNIFKRGSKKGKVIVYRKRNINKFYKFRPAVNELINLLQYLKFSCNVYYVDLKKVQHALGLDKKYSPVIKDIINRDYGRELLYPIYTVSKFLYKDHEKQLTGNRDQYGFVCYESQKENDMKVVQSFHEHLQKMGQKSRTYIYGKNVLGLNFYNKASLCSALEIADFMAYSTNQFLRLKWAKIELKNFDEHRLYLLLKSFKIVRNHFKVHIYDVTDDSINDYQELKRKIDKRKSKQKPEESKKASTR